LYFFVCFVYFCCFLLLLLFVVVVVFTAQYGILAIQLWMQNVLLHVYYTCLYLFFSYFVIRNSCVYVITMCLISYVSHMCIKLLHNKIKYLFYSLVHI
jgi:hypothetical protein